MIAKRVQRGERASSIQGLADYVLDRKGRGKKVLAAWSINCATPDDLDLATAEIRATQELNTRSKIDKTYHLVVSLAAGETLSEAQFKDIERKFSEALGFSEHQRLAVIHNDTNYLHMHIAISKIHPFSFNAFEPFYDKFKLQDVCRDLEREYGLQPGVSAEKVRIKVRPSEVHQGLETFETWIKENVRDELLALMKLPEKSWQDLGELLGKYGLEIRERGAGLVFSHAQKKLFVKASAVDRAFSKNALEKSLGIFVASATEVKPTKLYEPKPLKIHDKKQALYNEYRNEMIELRKKQNSMLSSDRELVYKKLEDIKKRYALRRLEVKRDGIIAKSRKRSIFDRLSVEMKKEVDTLISNSKKGRAQMREKSQIKPWLEWAHERASNGDETALEVLRRKHTPIENPLIGAIIGEKRNHVILSGIPRRVDRDGNVEYQVGDGSFVDRSDAIVLTSLDPSTVKAALLAARAKFGDRVTFKGSEEFMQITKIYVDDREKDLKKYSLTKGRGIDVGLVRQGNKIMDK